MRGAAAFRRAPSESEFSGSARCARRGPKCHSSSYLRPVWRHSLTIRWWASSSLLWLFLTYEMGFCRPCFSRTSTTLKRQKARTHTRTLQDVVTEAELLISLTAVDALQGDGHQLVWVPDDLLLALEERGEEIGEER
ncbi:hypothetical protein EYF80_039664 [Liparis tanakae]|uniref:Uncharacterized protein n=1 Tax=Liparis tanakae TaxID=230148 RepID=A0A4Z2GA72_9TELE|nr:hypothetical protein EYF80_039664 [Liparis tanakae]